MKTILDITYGAAAHPLQKLDIYLPDCDTFPTFLFFHGGGFNAGDKKEAELFAEHLTKNGIALVSATIGSVGKCSGPNTSMMRQKPLHGS